MTVENSPEQRERVVAEALSWLGTPFHHVADIKGVGVDCAHFIARVFENAGVIGHVDIAPYLPQSHLHLRDERFLSYVFSAGAREIDEASVQPGDCVLYKIGRSFSHGAIIAEWPGRIVHAWLSQGAVVTSAAFDGELAGKPVRFFSLWSAAA
jgi:cell wall-associated NlpC family hydrolase